MPPGISPEAVQRVLPFIEKLALSPRAEQSGAMMDNLLSLTRGKTPIPPDNWRRLIGMLPKGGTIPGAPQGFSATPYNVSNNTPSAIRFGLEQPGRSSWGGSVGRGAGPDELYTNYLTSGGSRRAGVGGPEGPFENY